MTTHPTPHPRTHPRDDGFATVLAAMLIAGVIAATLVLFHLAAIVTTHRRVEAAADLAALAGAARLLTTDGCGPAARVAHEMGGRLRDCLVEGWEVTVRVEIEFSGVLSMFGATSAWARAGPAEL